MVLIQDTRNKKGKPLRNAVEAGAEKAGTVIRMQALPYGDYCALNDRIQWVMDDAAEARLSDLKGKAAENDLTERMMHLCSVEGLPADVARRIANRTPVIVDQWQNDRTNLARDRFAAVQKADLIGLYGAAVETKWRIDELSQCINDHNFCKELRSANWYGCRLLVLIITDHTKDYMDIGRINEYITEISKYGAYLDICSEADAYRKIVEWLNNPHNYHIGMDDTFRQLTNTI